VEKCKFEFHVGGKKMVGAKKKFRRGGGFLGAVGVGGVLVKKLSAGDEGKSLQVEQATARKKIKRVGGHEFKYAKNTKE